jgi:hypothetical protein
MRKSCCRLALRLALGVFAAEVQGVELSIVKTIDILAGQPRPLAGQTSAWVQAAFNTRDGGVLELSLASERPAGAWATPYLLSRFAADGALLWSQELTNSGIYTDAIVEGDDGNVVFSGASYGPQGIQRRGFFQFSLADGRILNDLPLDSYRHELPLDLFGFDFPYLIRYQDGFLAAGNPNAGASPSDAGFVFLKFTTNLFIEWQRRIPPISTTHGPIYPPCRALLAGPAGDFLFSASGALVRMNTNGVVVKRGGGVGAPSLAQILRTSDGGYLMAGYGVGLVRDDSDYVITKANANMENQWTRLIGGNQGELLVSVQQTEDGGFLLFGHSQTEEISGSKGVQGAGAWLVKTDERGLKQGEMVIPNLSADASRLIRAASGFAIIGKRYQEGSGSFDPQIYRWELSVTRRARITAHSATGQSFNIDVSTNLATWLPVVVGFSGELQLREVIGSGNKFWRAYEASDSP